MARAVQAYRPGQADSPVVAADGAVEALKPPVLVGEVLLKQVEHAHHLRKDEHLVPRGAQLGQQLVQQHHLQEEEQTLTHQEEEQTSAHQEDDINTRLKQIGTTERGDLPCPKLGRSCRSTLAPSTSPESASVRMSEEATGSG